MMRLNISQKMAGLLERKYSTPLYVYDADKITNKCKKLKQSIKYPETSIHYAMKANSNPEVLKLIKENGLKVEAVSRGEVDLALKCGFKPIDIKFTCSNVNLEELKYVDSKNILISLDSVSQLEKYVKIHPRGRVSVRINQGIGAGHHSHVITGGKDSKFGIDLDQIEE